MKYNLSLLTVILFTACVGKAPRPASSVSETRLPANVVGIRFAHGGWYGPEDGLRGTEMQIAIDVPGQKFTLQRTDFYEAGDVSCPAVAFGVTEYRRLVDNIKPLHQITPPQGSQIDGGIATLDIEGSDGNTVRWILENSDANSLGLPMLAGERDLLDQLSTLADQIPCPAPVRRISYARSGGHPGPGVPIKNEVSVTIDHAHHEFTYQTFSDFATGRDYFCHDTVSGEQYDRLVANIAAVQRVDTAPSMIVDAGVGSLTLVSGRKSERSTLLSSDSFDPKYPVVDATALEAQLYGYVRSCLSQN